jgi:hypothetical protein
MWRDPRERRGASTAAGAEDLRARHFAPEVFTRDLDLPRGRQRQRVRAHARPMNLLRVGLGDGGCLRVVPATVSATIRNFHWTHERSPPSA